jgi:RND family efflux transporter MFP subunit
LRSLLIAVLVVGLAAAAARAEAAPEVKVLVQTVAFTPDDRVFEAVGTGRARLSADIHPAIAEEVVAVHFEAQQEVGKGDLLVQLDDRAERLAVRLAEVELADARALLRRYEAAEREGAVPASEVDSARADRDAAQVALEQARLALDERRITAPFAGVVGIPNVDPGDRVDPDTLITGLDARDRLYVDFEVPEALAGVLRRAQREGRTVTARTPAYPGRTFEAALRAQESRLDAARRTLRARAVIANEADLLRPGMSFTVRWKIPGETHPTVPEIAVQWGREGSFVWLVRQGRAERVMARVVARKAGRVLLDGPIQEGEAVVVEGLQRLRPGTGVDVIGTLGGAGAP